MHAVAGKTADESWREAAELFAVGGPARPQRGRGGATEEVLHVMLQIADPRQRWVVSRTPPMNPAFALVEVFWIVAGRADIALPAFWNPRLPQYCGNAATLHGAYGYRLRAHLGIDQLDRVYRALERNPDSRQAVLQIWDSSIDLPHDDGTPARDDIPCNVVAMPKVRGGRLEWLQVMRSNDVFRGLPYNIVQFTALQEMIAGWLQVDVGAYHHLSDSLHVYANDLAAVRESVVPCPCPPDEHTFALSRSDWNTAMANTIRRLEAMVAPAICPDSLREVALANDLPAAYEHSVRIAGADAARRHGWPDLADEFAEACDNAALRVLWSRWIGRVSKSSTELGRRPVRSATR